MHIQVIHFVFGVRKHHDPYVGESPCVHISASEAPSVELSWPPPRRQVTEQANNGKVISLVDMGRQLTD
jgi:hypothetical protein